MKGFTVTRHFRGADYHITVDNNAGVEKGVKSIMVDGNPHEGVIPVFGDGKVHKIIVVLGDK